MLNYDISAQVILGTTEDDDEQIWVGRSDLKFWTKIKELAPKIRKSDPKMKKIHPSQARYLRRILVRSKKIRFHQPKLNYDKCLNSLEINLDI